MSRRTVNGLLIVFLLVTWGAMFLRIDRFPLTWVPMYSVYERSNRIGVRVEDREAVRRGLRVTRRDGSEDWIDAEELNISKWILSRIYYQRVFGKGPAKHAQGNKNLGAFNRWIRGLGPDELRFEVDWEPRLFESLNRTLGLEPDDPRFIVRIRARQERIYYHPDTLEVRRRKVRRADLRWQEAWRSRWGGSGG